MEISCYLEQKDDSNIVTISDVFPDSPGEMCYNELAMRESTEDCHMADACLLNWQRQCNNHAAPCSVKP